MARSEGEGEGGVQLGGVEGVVGVLELELGFGLEGGFERCGEGGGREVDVQEGVQTGDGADGGGVEGGGGVTGGDDCDEKITFG